MGRKYYRRRYVNRDKYSVEQTAIRSNNLNLWTHVEPSSEFTGDSSQWSCVVVPSTTLQGTRKVKHLTFSIANTSSLNEDISIMYALVYVPQGTPCNSINFPSVNSAVNLYEPNQFVMSQGVLDFSAGPARIRCPLSRNLNSGDAIYLVLATAYNSQHPSPTFLVSVRYAITLQ